MKSKFGAFFQNIKNIQPTEVAQKLIQTSQKLTSKQTYENLILDAKMKSTQELENLIDLTLHQLLKNEIPSESVSEDEVKNEIKSMFTYRKNENDVKNIMKCVNEVFISNFPTSFYAAKNYKHYVAKSFIEKAKKRVQARGNSFQNK